MSQYCECNHPCCPPNHQRPDGVFGRIYNQISSALTPAATPQAVVLEAAGPIRNVGATPGALRVLAPGTYEITYTLGLTRGYDDDVIPNDTSAARKRANAQAEADPRIAPNVYAEIVSGVLVNGVELSSATAYHDGYLCCYEAITMHNSTIVELPAGTIITAALWSASDCISCEGRLTVLPSSQLYINRIGE